MAVNSIQSPFCNFNAFDTYSPITLYDETGKSIATLQPNRPVEYQNGQYNGKVASAVWNGVRFVAQATGPQAFVQYTPVAVSTPKDGKTLTFLGYGLEDPVIFLRQD